MTAISILQQRLITRQKLVDKELRPAMELLAKDPRKYATQWKKYLKQTEKCVEEFKADLDYHPSLTEEESSTAKPRARKLKTASVDLARTASRLDEEIGGEFYAHFIKELGRLKSRHKDHSNLLNSLDTSSPDAFSRSFKIIAKDLPRNIKEDLKALPYKHPATLFLKLKPEQYNELNRAADRRKVERHEDVSSISLKQVATYIEKVYSERHENFDYSHLCIALQFATGRRRAELGLLSKITPSEKLEGHISIDRFAKSNNTNKPHDLPVVFLSVQQAIELHELLRERLDNLVFADKKEIWNQIKRRSDTDRFDDYTKRVRITFQNEFNLRSPDVPESDTENITVHNACRSVYAQFAYKTRNARYKKMSLLAFANRVLGHTPGDYKTTENYLRVEMIDDRFDPPAAEKVSKASTEIPTPTPASIEAEDPPSSPLEVVTLEMDGSTSETPSMPAIAPFQPKRKGRTAKERTAPPSESLNTPSAPAGGSTLTATGWKSETPTKGKRPLARPKSTAKAPAVAKKFFAAVRSPAFVKDLMLYSLKIKEPGLIDIQRAINVRLDRIPTLEDLQAIASENAVALYLKFLKRHRIEHAIEAQPRA